MESEERAAFFPRIFSSFSSFWEGGNRPRTFNDPTLVNPSSYSYAHSTARRKQEAHAGRSPEHCRGTHHQSAKRARPPKGTRERRKFSHLELGGMAYFALSSSTRPARNIHNLLLVWRRRPVTAGRPCPWVLVTLDGLFPRSVFSFQQIATTRTTTGRVSPLLPTHPRPPVLGSCQQQQQGASMGRTVSDSCWSATDPAGPAVLGSSTK